MSNWFLFRERTKPNMLSKLELRKRPALKQLCSDFEILDRIHSYLEKRGIINTEPSKLPSSITPYFNFQCHLSSTICIFLDNTVEDSVVGDVKTSLVRG